MIGTDVNQMEATLRRLPIPCYWRSKEDASSINSNTARLSHPINQHDLFLSIDDYLNTGCSPHLVDGAEYAHPHHLLVIVPYHLTTCRFALVFIVPYKNSWTQDLKRIAYIKDSSGHYFYLAPFLNEFSDSHYKIRHDHELSWDDREHMQEDDQLAYRYGQQAYLCDYRGHSLHLCKHRIDDQNNPLGLAAILHDPPESPMPMWNDSSFQTIIDQIPSLCYCKDQFGVYRGCNIQMAQSSGFDSVDDIIGKSDYQLPWRELATAIVNHDKQVMNEGRCIVREQHGHAMVKNRLRKMAFISQKDPLFDPKTDKPQKAIGICGNSINLCQEKAYCSRLEQSLIDRQSTQSILQSKNEFIANMNHDIRTPLAGMVGMAQMILDTDGDDNASDAISGYAQKIAQAGQELLDMHNDILELSKAEQKNLADLSENFSLTALTETLSNLYQPQMACRGLRWGLHVEPNVPQQFWGAKSLLQRSLLNLIGNALKFTEEGEVNLTFSLGEPQPKATHALNEDEVLLICTVHDTGIGIPSSKIHSIFKPFKRVPTQKAYTGSGLGLHIVKQFTEKMHGSIQVTSQEGVGTTFTLTVPLPYCTDQKSEVSTHVNQTTINYDDQNHSYGPVAVIEDNEMAQQVACHMLRQLHKQIDVFDLGQTAIKAIQKGHYHLIYLDLGLPDMDGLEVCRAIRQWEAQCHRNPVPIIGLTAHIEPEIAKNYIEQGFSDIFLKPLLTAKAQEAAYRYLTPI